MKIFAEFTASISRQLQSGATLSDETGRIASILRDRLKAKSLLESLLTEQDSLGLLAKKSYAHNNGFDVFTLHVSEQPPFEIRLHIWWPEAESYRREHIHNHAWNYGTCLITGAYHLRLFREAIAGEEMHCYECSIPNQGAGYKMAYYGLKPVECVFDAAVHTGAVYTLDHKVLHTVTKYPSELTSTLMIHGPFTRLTSNIYTTEKIPPGFTNFLNKRLFSIEMVETKLRRYLSFLESSG
jgi:hypothetical protein